MSDNRTLTGEQARKLIDDILVQTKEPFLLHMNWKPQEGGPGEIRQHLSIHGQWNANEILATGKGRNQQIEEIVMRSMKGGSGSGSE